MPGCRSTSAGSPIAGPGRCCRAKRSCGSATSAVFRRPCRRARPPPWRGGARGAAPGDTGPSSPDSWIEVTVDFSLTEEEKAIRDTARAFLRNEVLPLEQEVLRREREHRPGLEHAELVELQQKAKAFGFWGLSTPQEYGGMGLSAVMQSLIWTEVARSWVPFRFGGEADNILYHANEEQKREYLLPTIAGDRI